VKSLPCLQRTVAATQAGTTTAFIEASEVATRHSDRDHRIVALDSVIGKTTRAVG
jgi:hypothetical protein